MSQFTKNWERPRTETLAGRVKDTVKNEEVFKLRSKGNPPVFSEQAIANAAKCK